MKNLMILILLALSSISMASTELGGTLKTRDGQKMKFTCETVDNVCEEINIQVTWDEHSDFYNHSVLDVKPTEVTRDAFRRATRDLNDAYFAAGIVGTAVGIWTCGMGGGAAACLGILPLGIAVDLVKAPVVGVAYIGHKIGDLITKRRFKRDFKHLMNLKKKGKMRRISKRDFEALLQAL